MTPNDTPMTPGGVMGVSKKSEISLCRENGPYVVNGIQLVPNDSLFLKIGNFVVTLWHHNTYNNIYNKWYSNGTLVAHREIAVAPTWFVIKKIEFFKKLGMLWYHFGTILHIITYKINGTLLGHT